ncbi:MAG TPA: hypothetical protein VGJ75_00380 [Dongiaceae bacterium]|jgi:hypothetical protein
MRRFDLIEEYTSVVVPKLSARRDCDADQLDADRAPQRGGQRARWRSVGGAVALVILVVAIAIF